ncbi:hypothetical protein [Nocardioides sp. YIM 152315]|nr:hypothetical protein [Nocardioides sp. YIM 152315]MDF1603048.1 hypothetical protein [Nocardioides sp. YIM 152315]
MLLTVASYVVRCEVDALTCERTTDRLPIGWNESAQLSPTRVD